MVLEDGVMRRLRYPLNLSVSPLVEGGDMESPVSLTPNWQTSDNDERVTITLKVSLNEFVALASAIDIGRDLGYGAQSIELWQIWARSINTMELCQQIADCLSDVNSPTYTVIQQIINNWINENTDIPVYNEGVPSTPTYYDADPELINLGEDCDLDQLFGAIREILRVFNDSITDLLEIVEAQTNTAELAQKVSSKIPFFGEYVESIPEWLDWLIEVFAENYASAYTTTLYDEMCCDLFCLAKDSCTLSFQTFADYFGSKVGATMSGDIASIWDEIMSTAWAGNNCVYAMHFLVCSAVAFGQNFIGLDSAFLTRIIQIGIGYPDNDWTLLCEDCPSGYSKTWDFKASEQGFSGIADPYSPNEGLSWASGYGFTVGVGDYDQSMGMECLFAESFNVQSASMQIRSYGDALNTGSFVVILNGTSHSKALSEGTWDGDLLTITIDGFDMNGTLLQFRVTQGQSNGGWRAENASVAGNGSEPHI